MRILYTVYQSLIIRNFYFCHCDNTITQRRDHRAVDEYSLFQIRTGFGVRRSTCAHGRRYTTQQAAGRWEVG
jgi:hypothetical protein